MKIGFLKVNHLVNPLGNELDHPSLSYRVLESSGKRQESARILVALDPDFKDTIFDSGERKDISSLAFELPFEPEAETRYFWKAFVTADDGDSGWSDTAWFETPKEDAWQADWITPKADKSLQVILFKDIELKKPVARARAYMAGLGLYEFYLNGQKQGEEYLLPGFCAYDSWIPFQTFELKLQEGANRLEVMLGDGWYKGEFGLTKKKENYGDRLAMIAEIHVTYEDGTKEVFCSDTSWKAKASPVTFSGIYPGEVYEPGLDQSRIYDTEVISSEEAEEKSRTEEYSEHGQGGEEQTENRSGGAYLNRRGSYKDLLRPRLDPRLVCQEKLKPVEIIHTPMGETVLDMGQNMVGWLSFTCRAKAGRKFFLQFGEILQDGCFYNENLRSAKAEFTYISDGEERLVRPHFTFYGFRYVKITGWDGSDELSDFCGMVIHSEMERQGDIQTSYPLVNRLFLNAWWGQKGNFLDVPTDCPQRDERYGWTGDAQIFSGTACFNADTYAFYTKFGYDLACEQKKMGGAVPDVVPTANFDGTISSVWGDAATVIPWNVYLHTGDPGILRRQYDSMKGWVDYIKSQDDQYGGRRLWQTGFQYGDWLALDGNVKGGVYGATDPFLIASAYYYYSTTIVAKAAAVLGRDEDAAAYRKLASEIKEAFVKEYYTPSGRLSVDTMTAYVVVLYLGLVPDGNAELSHEPDRNGRKIDGGSMEPDGHAEGMETKADPTALELTREGLMNRLRKKFFHLETGFTGTPWLCQVLSENGMHELACHLLLEKGYPGWLYEVLMGATTIWERWNSVLPDGKISGTEMNSLNHYAYGSIVEWMYRELVGFCPSMETAGFKTAVLAPKPTWQIPWVRGTVNTAAGKISSGWKLDQGVLNFQVKVPFDCRVRLVLPDAKAEEVKAEVCRRSKDPGEQGSREGILQMTQAGANTEVVLEAGTYTFTYKPTRPYRKVYSLDTPLAELDENPKTRAILDRYFYSVHRNSAFKGELCTLRETLQGPFTHLPYEEQDALDKALREVE